MTIRSLEDIHASAVKNKTCILRIDLNITEAQKGVPFRIKAVLPTIRYLTAHAQKVIIVSHRGRPEARKEWKGLSLKPFAGMLGKGLRKNITFVPYCTIEEIRAQTKKSENRLFLLENMRFFPGEEEDSQVFAEELASLGNIYINDAFAVSHRKNASVHAITKCLPSYAGFQLEKEVRHLERAMRQYEKPLTLVLGGAKIDDKVGVLAFFRKRADAILLGGGIANTFLYARGVSIGSSIRGETKAIAEYENMKNIHLPKDWVSSKGAIMDIGKKTAKAYSDVVRESKTVIWNGPMGVVEKKRYAQGTHALARAVASIKRKAFTVVGGGETTSLVLQHGLEKKFDLVSTGGGAMLEFLSGKKLSGIEALRKE